MSSPEYAYPVMVTKDTAVGKCSLCDAQIFNPTSINDLWSCDHGPHGTYRRRRNDRDLLMEIIERLERIEKEVKALGAE